MSYLFFINAIDSKAVQVLEGEEAHHAIKVLRLTKGEQLVLSDGKSSWVSLRQPNLQADCYRLRLRWYRLSSAFSALSGKQGWKFSIQYRYHLSCTQPI